MPSFSLTSRSLLSTTANVESFFQKQLFIKSLSIGKGDFFRKFRPKKGNYSVILRGKMGTFSDFRLQRFLKQVVKCDLGDDVLRIGVSLQSGKFPLSDQ